MAALAAAIMLTVPALAAAEEVTPAPTPVNTGAPTVTGTPAPGQTLACSTGAWSGNPNGFSYAWLRDGVAIAGQTGSTYVVQTADQGHSISCQVTASNSGGEYTIVGLPSASYSVSFYPFIGNYLLQYFNNQPEATPTPVPVTAPNSTGGINAEMHAGGEITGKVTAAAGGVPIANVDVCAGETHVGGGCAYTNAGGEYTIVALPTGSSYTVAFYPDEGNYVGQTAAGTVSVIAGGTPANVNAALAVGGKITGKITAEAGGAPIVGGEACAFEPTASVFGGCASTNSNGEYTIQGLAAGSKYEVAFTGDGCSETGCAQQNYLSVTVSGVSVAEGSTRENVDGALPTGGEISGTVSGAEGGGNIEVCANEPTEGYFECASTNAGGEYTIPALNSGKYEVEFSPISTCGAAGCMRSNYVSQAYSANPVSVVAGSTRKEIGASMTAAGKITGRITAEAGGGPIAAEACAYEPTAGFEGGCGYANSNGEYMIQGLQTGTYEVTFYGENCSGATCVELNYVRKKKTGVSVTNGSTTPNVSEALATGGQITGRVTDASTHAGLSNVEVCASAEVNKESYGECIPTSGVAKGSATARSNALTVPAPISAFKLTGSSFDAKSGDLVFTFQFANAGALNWSLSFRNSDVGFADSLGVSLGEGNSIAEAAKSKGKGKSKRCKKGFTKHAGKCVRLLVPFSSGSQNVSAGTVKVTVHASGKALKALKNGHTLHVSGTFSFQSALGGAPTTKDVMVVVHPQKKKGKHGKHSKHGG